MNNDKNITVNINTDGSRLDHWEVRIILIAEKRINMQDVDPTAEKTIAFINAICAEGWEPVGFIGVSHLMLKRRKVRE